MSSDPVLSVFEKIGSGIAHGFLFVKRLASDVKEADDIYHALTPVAKKSMVLIMKDITQIIADSALATQDNLLNLQLDSQLISDVTQLIIDGRNGEQAAVAALNALQIKF